MYTAWSVVAFEVPTAAKWNILGANDASFNDGTGIDDGVILTRHILNGNVTTDKLADDSVTSAKLAVTIGDGGNGYTVYDFGTFKIFRKTGTVSGSLAANGFGTVALNPGLPTGYSNFGSFDHVRQIVRTNDQAITATPYTFAGSATNLNCGITNQYAGGTVSFSGTWDLELIDVL